MLVGTVLRLSADMQPVSLPSAAFWVRRLVRLFGSAAG
jgi:hypothetical protein